MPAISEAQTDFYEAKLAFETDSWDLFAAVSAGEKIAIVDVRTADAFDAERIPGAVNFPHRSMDAASTARLDRSPLYVVYCDGIGCNGSTKGALKLSKLGFRVKELIGGIEWWIRDGYATEGAKGRAGTEIECGCGPSL